MVPWIFGVLFSFLALPSFVMQPQTAKAAECQLCFYGPDNMVFDSAGNVYLVDTDRKSRFRVMKVSADGKFLDQWNLFKSGPGIRPGPEGIAITSDGDIFVTDGGALAVLKLSPTGKLLMRIGGDGSTFEDLGHVAVNPRGHIYVAEAARNSIQQFSPDGKPMVVWKRSRGNGPDDWNSPESIAVRSDGTVAVEDWRNRRIVVVSSTGKTLFSFGSPGDGPGQFTSSSGLAVDSVGDFYIPDDRLHRVQKFDPSGHLLFVLSNTPTAHLFDEGPGGIAIDGQGNLYAPDGLKVVKFSPEGRILARWR